MHFLSSPVLVTRSANIILLDLTIPIASGEK
jgi:hypothetical protein